MKLRLLITLLFACTCLSAQSFNASAFETNSLWVKVKPQYKDLFNSSGLSQNRLRETGVQQAQTLFQPSILKMDQAKLSRKKGSSKSNIDLAMYYTLNIAQGADLKITINKLKASGYFDLVEPVPIAQVLYMPDDDFVDSTNSFNAPEFKLINAYKAWDVEKGDSNVVIGISDLGVDYTHDDLKDNIKYNYNDPIDSLDNDGDGYLNNFCGWDFAQNDNDVMSDPQAAPHGTEVSSVASSTPDNDIMLCGSGFYCKFLPLKIASRGAIYIDAAYNSIMYAALHGLKVINLSWTEGNVFSQIHQDIITKAVLDYDLAVVAAAGNAHMEIDYYPASYEHVLSIAGSALDSYWGSATYSNFVDISAPAYLSILTDGNSAGLSAGSSISAPLVSGALGLVRSKYPGLTAIQAMERIRMAGTRLDTIPQYSTYKYLYGRRLDMYNALVGDPKSVRLTQFKVYTSNGSSLMGGDTVSLDLNFKNYLKPLSSNCKVRIKCDSSYIKLIDTELSLGALNTLDSKALVKAFKFVIDNNAPKLASVRFMLEYFDDDHFDYQVFTVKNINVNFLDLDTNDITLSIINKGKLGFSDFDATIGSGLKYKKANNSLYEGGLLLSTDQNKLSDCVRGISEPNDAFISTKNISYVHEGIADRHIKCSYKDTNANGVKVAITQNSFAWKDANLRNQVIIEYQLKNISGHKIGRLNAAVFMDLDIPSLGVNDPYAYSRNKTLWDSANNMSISYNTSSNGLYVGTRILSTQKPIFAALDNKNVNGKFTDLEKLRLLRSGVSSTKAGDNSSIGTDISELVGISIDSLGSGQTITFAVSFMVSTDILSLQAASQKILTKYKQFRTSAKPAAVALTVCKNSSVSAKIGQGQRYKFYKSIPSSPSTYLKTDSIISIATLSKDSSFYITNHDDVFESEPQLVKLSVDPFSANNFNAIDIGAGKYLFYTSQDFADLVWNTGDGHTGTTNNYIHEYTSNGSYQVTLSLKNASGCSDSSSKYVTVSKVITLLVEDILSDEIELYPIPTTDKLVVEIPESMQTQINAHVTNLIGVDTGEKYSLKPGKNSIDVSHLPHGIYFIHIFAYGKVYKFKFIVA